MKSADIRERIRRSETDWHACFNAHSRAAIEITLEWLWHRYWEAVEREESEANEQAWRALEDRMAAES